MRILFCNYEYPPLGGGGGVINASLAEELGKKHEVTVLTSGGLGLKDREVVNGVEIIRVPVFFRKRLQAANMPSLLMYVLNGIKHGRALLADRQFDLINSHFVIPTGLLGHILAKHSGLPHVISFHGGDVYDPSKFSSPHKHRILRVLCRKLMQAADCGIGNSVNTNANFINYFDPNDDSRLVPLGIPRVEIPDVDKSDYGYAADDIVLVTIGRLVSRKGVERLIDIMSRIKNDKIKLIIIGDGPKREEWEQQSNKLGLSQRIKFAGQATEDEKYSYLGMSDVYVSTSQHEGFGLVFLEGMAAGLPVICYDHGGQVDFMANDENGYVVKLNDADTFQQKIELLGEDVELRRKMSAKSLEIVEGLFIDSCAQHYEEIFNEFIPKNDA